MTVGNIATDGYGLNVLERPNVPINGYGFGLPSGLFDGKVKGIAFAMTILQSMLEQLHVIDGSPEAIKCPDPEELP